MSELSLPAGSLQGALQAFSGGADSVYLGLKAHSARKSAINFSLEQLSQLKQYAIKEDKKVYVALNTLLDDEELTTLVPTLRALQLLQVDGVIVQDLGLASLLREEYPSLALQSSTQLAVHTVEGVKALQQIGFSRIVLSRELTFAQIKEIRTLCPDVELKVFIHGAMCYGFSGLCMASQQLTGRSANKGECSQVCRTWFTYDKENRGFFFSMKDLAIERSLSRLQEIGIDSFKVEGRMKSPAYAYFAARYYRMILDKESDLTQLEEAKEALNAQFSRFSSRGWTFDYKKESPLDNRYTPSLITKEYPSHIGEEAATLLSLKREDLTLLLEKDLSVRDGAMLFVNGGEYIAQPLRFSVNEMRNRNNKPIFDGKRGDQVTIKLNEPIEGEVGKSLYRISRHDLHLSEINESSLLPFRYPLKLTIKIDNESLTVETKELPSWMGSSLKQTYLLDVQKAKTVQDPHKNLLTIFSSPSEGAFTCDTIDLCNSTTLAFEEIFLPLSSLKKIRKKWYKKIETRYSKATCTKKFPKNSAQIGEVLPPRHLLQNSKKMPWIDFTSPPVEIDTYFYVPLPPITFNESETLTQVENLIKRYKGKVRVGLNNVSHIRWAQSHPEIPCFIDIYLYLTNWRVAQLLGTLLPNVVGAYHWIEKKVQKSSHWELLVSDATEEFSPPLFISRSCFMYDALEHSCKGCPRKGSFEIEQSGKKYSVEVQNCITIVNSLTK